MGSQKGRPVICFPFVGEKTGGSHISAIGLIRNLDRSRYTPLVVQYPPVGQVAELLEREGIEFSISPTEGGYAPGRKLATLFGVPRAIPSLTAFLRRHNVAIVHTNDNRTHLPWGVAARLAGAKHLWHHRSDPSTFGLKWVAPFLASRVVSVSKFAGPKDGLISAARKCSVVHSPFDTSIADRVDRDACRAMLIEELGCPPDTRFIGYVGNIVDRKRPLVFVETIAELRRMAPDLNIAGVTFGEIRRGVDIAAQAQARAAELGVDDIVHLMGYRYPGEPWIAALDLLLVTAVNEPFGRTLIEAMLLGTPVVAANSGGNPEAIRDRENGVLATPDDPRAFAAASLEVLSDATKRAAIVEAAVSGAHERFGIDKHVDAIMSIYGKLLGDGSSRTDEDRHDVRQTQASS